MHLFGSILVRIDKHELGPRDFGGVKPKQILEILLASRGAPVSKDRLADSLWGDALPRNVSGTLETYVSVLRRRLDPDRKHRPLVTTEPGAYRFAVEEVEIDLNHFDALVQRASKADLRVGRPLLEEALNFARGDVLEDEPYAEWAAALREEYQKKVTYVLLDASEAGLAEDDYQPALLHAEQAMARDPLNERAYRLAMLGFYALGRQREALETFDRCRESLADDLGIDPLEQTRDLHMAILRQEDVASLLPRPRPERIEILDDVMSDRLPLLGRQEELSQVASMISSSFAGAFSLLAVEGESGIGKSRFLDEAAMRVTNARVGRARCSAVERELPYVPLAMALREALDGISIDQARYPGLAEVLPELWLSNPALEISPVKALECVAEIARENAPMVLFLDDAQWADAKTISAIGYMARRLQDVPVAIVLAFDPEEGDGTDPIGGLHPTSRLRLETLSEEDLEPLGMKDLYVRTGGHPSFVAACVGAKSEMEAGHMPPTLTELVLERSKADGERGHRILACASVLDQPFEPEMLATLMEADAFELLGELERLCDRQLLKVHDSGFSFRGELIREVISQSMSPARRRLLRQRALEFEAMTAGMVTDGRVKVGFAPADSERVRISAR